MVSLFNFKTRRTALMSLAGLVSALCMATPVAAQTAPKVKFVTTEGDFVVEVYPDKAPKTVENFLQYVKDKHYDGLIFHRVISNFMVQGGGYDAKYTEKATRPPVVHEGREALAKGGAKNVVGTLAMARTNDPNSASSQFFINVKDNDFLNPTVIPPGDPVPEFTYQGQTYKNTPRAQLLGAAHLNITREGFRLYRVSNLVSTIEGIEVGEIEKRCGATCEEYQELAEHIATAVN